jgi:hypothetical protein
MSALVNNYNALLALARGNESILRSATQVAVEEIQDRTMCNTSPREVIAHLPGAVEHILLDWGYTQK